MSVARFTYAYADVCQEDSLTLATTLVSLLPSDTRTKVKSEFHITLCFDVSGEIAGKEAYMPQEGVIRTGVIAELAIWKDQRGKSLLVAKLTDCPWTTEVNQWYTAQGIVEDLPHVPHVTLLKNVDQPLEDFQSLIGMTLRFEDPTFSW